MLRHLGVIQQTYLTTVDFHVSKPVQVVVTEVGKSIRPTEALKKASDHSLFGGFIERMILYL